jgi:hypothetical protein
VCSTGGNIVGKNWKFSQQRAVWTSDRSVISTVCFSRALVTRGRLRGRGNTYVENKHKYTPIVWGMIPYVTDRSVPLAETDRTASIPSWIDLWLVLYRLCDYEIFGRIPQGIASK